MKKKLWIVKCAKIMGSMMLCGTMLTACQQNTEKKVPSESSGEITKIVWQSNLDLEKRETYFNQLLKEKQLPYKVDFVREDNVKEGQIVDLQDTGMNNWEKTYDMAQEILDGKFIALDEYLDSEEGKAIKDTLPQKVWDTYQVNGKQYTILSVGFVPAKKVYIWDKALAEKYKVYPENWDEHLWNYEEELLKIYEGEKNDASFLTVQGIYSYLQEPIGMTKVLGLYYPIVISENENISNEQVKAEFLYETEKYKESLEGVQRLYEAGIYNPEKETSGENRVFLTIDTMFMSENAYASMKEDDFWETHAYKELWQEPLWQLSCNAKETGITTASKQPKEVFQFMCELYQDKELTNALMWGEENVDYAVSENGKRAVNNKSKKDVIFPNFVSNQLIGYAQFGQDEDKKEVYTKLLEEAKLSKINGFQFSGKSCEEELKKVFQISLQYRDGYKKDFLNENDNLIQLYQDAGIRKVIEEWNRQYQNQ